MEEKREVKPILKSEPKKLSIQNSGSSETKDSPVLGWKLATECTPVSPQPSVDRLSVTFLEPTEGSVASTKVNLFNVTTDTPINNMEDRLTLSQGDASEDEDYTASFRAVIERRGSSRRSRRGRVRRPSSPYPADPDLSVNRRFSSITNSSADTMMSLEEGQLDPQVVNQEQIYMNLSLHKEVLNTIKLGPWCMRKKLKLVHRAKTYIKRHEGALQERLAQSKSTRDIVARFIILVATKWQRIKREAANLSNLMIPWELRIKEIESHFGSVVASYFTFLRWLFWVNLVISLVLIVFVIVPEILTADSVKAGERKFVPPEERNKSGNLLILWEFEGVLKYSPLFYGYYTNVDSGYGSYRLPFAYFLTGLAVYIYSFVAILRKMAENSRMSKLSEKEDECIFSWKLFTGWDFMIGNAETAHNRTASIILGFKEALLEEAEKKRDPRNWKIISLRVVVNICVVFLFVVSAFAVIKVVNRSTEPHIEGKWWRKNETTVVVSLITFAFPIFFELLGFLECYHPRKQLRIQLARIMILNLLNLYSLIFATFSKITDMTLDGGGGNYTTNLIVHSNNTHTCYADRIDCPKLIKQPKPEMLRMNEAYINDMPYESTITINLITDTLNSTVITTENDINDEYNEGVRQIYKAAENYPLENENEEDFNDSYYDIENESPNKTNDYNETYDIMVTVSPNVSYTWILNSNLSNTDTSTIPSYTEADFNSTLNSDYYDSSEEQTDPVLTTNSEVVTTEDTFNSESTTEPLFVTVSSIYHTDDATITTDASYVDKKTTLNWEDNATQINAYDTETTQCEVQIKCLLNETDNFDELCWETTFGQELVKLTMMDLVLTILSNLFLDFFRALIVRFMNKCWCWDLEKTFPQYGDFKIAENILHLVNNQGTVWMGMFFSPGLVVLNLVKLVIIMYLRSWAVMTCNVPHEVVFRASRSNNFYLALLLTMLFLCVLPVGYAIVWIKPSWKCGPFSQYDRIYHIFTKNFNDVLPETLKKATAYIASPGIVIPLLVLLILIIYYLLSLTNSLREANIDLKIQLRRERTEERRKMFQLADRRRRGGPSDMENTVFRRWKRFASLRQNKSIDSDDPKNSDSIIDDRKKSGKKKGDIFARIVNMALRRLNPPEIKIDTSTLTPPNVDDETDTEFHESLPELRQRDNKLTNSSNSSEPNASTDQKLDLIKITHTKLRTRDIIKARITNEMKKHEIHKDPTDISQPKEIDHPHYKEKHDLKRLRSSGSKQSDSISSVIPVITISNTESDDDLDEKRSKIEVINESKASTSGKQKTKQIENTEYKSDKSIQSLKSLRRQSSVDSVNELMCGRDKRKEEGHKFQYSL